MRKWWKEGIVYQVYPRSFYDSNGDGIGDLQGVIEKLDYIQSLGADIIWLNPVYRSPNDDNGYDISDYYSIMEDFGTMADWEQLLAQMHQRGMKLIMDLVVNHTSDEHPWFVEARASKDSLYRDYYVWRPADGKQPPNNWRSFFSGSVWELDEQTDEYYLHLFSKKQPDLNWEQEEVRLDIYSMMKWWLDKGIDGFRMDVINMISKPPQFEDAAPVGDDGYANGGDAFINGPRVHEYLQEMNQKVLRHYDILTVGECPGTSPEEALKYVGEDRQELQMLFQFEHMKVDRSPDNKFETIPWKLTTLKRVLTKWQTELHGRGWNSLYWMNHDQPRTVSRFGNDGQYRIASAQMLATCNLTMQGTPYIYQGEEIGMTNVHFTDIEDYQDLESVNYYHTRMKLGEDPRQVLEQIHQQSRDNSRTPMQWDASEHAGFTTGSPWLKVNPNYASINVEQDRVADRSIFAYYQQLIQLRKEHLTLVYGSFENLLEEDEQLFAYVRKDEQGTYLIILNFTEQEARFQLPDYLPHGGWEKLLGNDDNYHDSDQDKQTPANLQNMIFSPYEAAVYRLQP
ncbi:glycoside hydrolase family 13 protein [Marinicrinis sediminis]|uniref:oligo-1,6-glucosidase n=1 Tax=Marinicrinis sediminis TaxID=1652465 RepID=A0ABW5R817_9BACL